MPKAVEKSKSNWVSASSPEVLSRINSPETLLAVWERSPNQALELALSALLATAIPLRLDLESGQLARFREGLLRHLGRSAWKLEQSIEALTDDVAELTKRFSDLSGREHLRIRFERVEDDGCALFHVDTLPMRMLCTYAGPGTQWVEEDHVRRDQLGARGRSLSEANAAIVPDAQQIRTVPAWHVLVFKGRLWEGHGFSDGLVHRSAPVDGPGDYRLRLTIDFSESCTC
jgi:hypothetical protein